jgi:hypothetical protein
VRLWGSGVAQDTRHHNADALRFSLFFFLPLALHVLKRLPFTCSTCLSLHLKLSVGSTTQAQTASFRSAMTSK